VVAIVTQGITTSGIIEGATLIFTEDDVIRLKGSTMLDFDVSWRRASGLSGPYSWTRDNAGTVYWFDRTGDVRAMGETLEPATLSGEMRETFRDTAAAHRAEWVMLHEPQTHRLLCFMTPDGGAWECHALHMEAQGGWDDLSVAAGRLARPYSAAVSGSGDAAYGVIGGAAGAVQRAMDTTPGLSPTAWSYRTGQRDMRQRVRVVEARGRCEGGAVTVTASLDGAALPAVSSAGRFRERFGLYLGRVLSVRLAGAAGSSVKDLAVIPAMRGEAQ
jgi:hypothetical protein